MQSIPGIPGIPGSARMQEIMQKSRQIVDPRVLWIILMSILLIACYQRWYKKISYRLRQRFELIENFKSKRMLPYIINGPALRGFYTKQSIQSFPSNFVLTTLRTSVTWGNLINVLNAYGCNYLRCDQADKQKMYTFFINQLTPWATDDFNIMSLSWSNLLLIQDIFIHFHVFDSDPDITMDAKSNRLILDWLTKYIRQARGAYSTYSGTYSDDVGNIWPLTCDLLNSIVVDDMPLIVRHMAVNYVTILTSFKRGDPLTYIYNDASGATFKKFSIQASSLLFGIYLIHKCNMSDMLDMVAVRQICDQLKALWNTFSDSSAIKTLTSAEVAGLVLPWVVFAVNLFPHLMSDSGYSSLLSIVKNNVWSGMGGSTYLHFGQG